MQKPRLELVYNEEAKTFSLETENLDYVLILEIIQHLAKETAVSLNNFLKELEELQKENN